MKHYQINNDITDRKEILESISARISDIKHNGAIILISGLMGVGKTTIINEINRMAKIYEYRTVKINIHTSTSSSPLHPFMWVLEKIDMDNKSILINNTDKIPLGLLPMTDIDITDSTNDPLPIMLSHYSVDINMRNYNDSENTIDDENIYRMVLEKLNAIASKEPLIILLDDFHNADIASFKMLLKASKTIKEKSIVIFASIREDLITSEIEPYYKNIDAVDGACKVYKLEPFTYSETSRYIEKSLKTTNISPYFITWMFQKSGGNPLILSEYLKEAIKRGYVQKRDDGKYVVQPNINMLSNLENLKNIMNSLLSTLTVDELNFLNIIAIVGTVFSKNIVKKVMDIEENKFSSLIEHLLKKRLIKNVTPVIYSFTYPVMVEYILDSMSKARKRLYNRKVAKAIEKYGILSKPDILYSLAYHYYDSMDLENSYKYCVMAADTAKKTNKIELSIAFYRKVINIMNEIGVSVESEIEIYNALGELSYAIGKWEDSLAYYTYLYNLGREHNNSNTVAVSSLKMGLIHIGFNNFDMAEEHLQDAISIFNKNHDILRLKEVQRIFGYLYWRKGDLKKAEDTLLKASMLSYIEPSIDGPLYIDLGNIEVDKNNFENAFNYYNKAINILNKSTDFSSMSRVYNNMGDTYIKLNNIEQAIHFFEVATDYARRSGNRDIYAWSLLNQSNSNIKLNKFKKAKELGDEAMNIMDEIEDTRGIVAASLNLANLNESIGENEYADLYYQKAIKNSENIGNAYLYAESLERYGLFLIKLEGEKKEKGISNLKKAKNIFEMNNLENKANKIDSILKNELPIKNVNIDG